jgi:hypothetical protein
VKILLNPDSGSLRITPDIEVPEEDMGPDGSQKRVKKTKPISGDAKKHIMDVTSDPLLSQAASTDSEDLLESAVNSIFGFDPNSDEIDFFTNEPFSSLQEPVFLE